ncbi:MAG: phosphoribosylformylglycinamidine cyclo-ligase [Planctomycetota bacterium]|nr:phosphoribosylformylglycinamidine cyclo-ligase [Planctomycetota bacterium]MDI6788258.1 phosphoribosylformylglycinamidine cyclo-ligase [Planctomycetota bacterium]
MLKELTYKSAGVDTVKKDAIIDEIIRLSRKTYDPRVIQHPWGFAGFFSLEHPDRVFRKGLGKAPALVACTDGVGTKLKLAFLLDKHDTVGIDLVAMSVNDLIVSGAEPLFFLDYISCGKVDERIIHEIIKGIVKGCESAGCALLGGETAEMPDFYAQGEYDLAGFAVGIIDKNKIITGSAIKTGDVVIGLGSSGLHSNGFSLVRKVFGLSPAHNLNRRVDKSRSYVLNKLNQYIPSISSTLAEELLKPTIIYAKATRDVLSAYLLKKVVKGIAHITGGGMIENIPRILPSSLRVEIDASSYPCPPIFPLIQETGNITKEEMYRVFNMGIGMVIIVDRFYADAIIRRIKKAGYYGYIIGKVVVRKPQEKQVIII